MYEGLPLSEADSNVGRFARHERRGNVANAASSDDQPDEFDSQACMPLSSMPCPGAGVRPEQVCCLDCTHAFMGAKFENALLTIMVGAAACAGQWMYCCWSWRLCCRKGCRKGFCSGAQRQKAQARCLVSSGPVLCAMPW